MTKQYINKVKSFAGFQIWNLRRLKSGFSKTKITFLTIRSGIHFVNKFYITDIYWDYYVISKKTLLAY